jgi:hypothetical protein
MNYFSIDTKSNAQQQNHKIVIDNEKASVKPIL